MAIWAGQLARQMRHFYRSRPLAPACLRSWHWVSDWGTDTARAWGLGSCALLLMGCNGLTPGAIATSARAEESLFAPPSESEIPTGPLGDMIRLGLRLLNRSYEEMGNNVGNRLHCTSCHLQSGRTPYAGPWVGISAVFPAYSARNGKVNLLADRINECLERSLNGKSLPADSTEMVAMVSYMTWLSRGVPVGSSVPGRGLLRIRPPQTPDRARGEKVYQARCRPCHEADGRGRFTAEGGYQYPPLWGPDSFNIGAGMARLDTAAAFIKHNMPVGQGETLSAQDAYDVADYVIHKPRPDFSAKSNDWPNGDKPHDARY